VLTLFLNKINRYLFISLFQKQFFSTNIQRVIIFKKTQEITDWLRSKAKNYKSVGFVPTMGALHEGHLSLIEFSKIDNDLTVCSIFVNPTQFNNTTDFEKYPSTLESDIYLLEKAGCDILFLPQKDEIYPVDFLKKNYTLGYLENILEGKYRPGHFQGVCMVVDRLLDIVPCNTLYLGRKDYQQCLVLQKMAKEFHPNVFIKTCETKRTENGLAMSSRNLRLNETERKTAEVLFKCLSQIKNEATHQSLVLLLKTASDEIVSAGFDIDYLAVTDNALIEITHLTRGEIYVVLVAATINKIRLIDNLIFTAL
jgi:pantoate--beta-alanine ligase